MLKDSARWKSRDPELAYLVLRATLGLNIFMHGSTRILAGPGNFAQTLVPLFARTPLPPWSVYGFGLVLPFIEALAGLLLLVGLQTRLALIAGGGVIFVLTFGTALRQDWQTAGLQLIYTAVYAALLAGVRWNFFSIDSLLQRTRTIE